MGQITQGLFGLELKRLWVKGEGMKKHKQAVTNSHRAAKYSMGNTANDMAIATQGVRWGTGNSEVDTVKCQLSAH